MSRGRCSPTEALALLSPVFAPMAAADELTRAIHSDRCHPYCRGVVIRSDIAPRLIVVAHAENDGRWTARIESTSYAPGGVQPAGVWEFEIDEVIELRQRAEAAQAAAATTTDNSRRRDPPGPKPTDEWPEDVKAAVALKICDDPKILRKPNYDALNREIRADFGNADRWLPKDPKETEKIIREFIQRLRGLTPP